MGREGLLKLNDSTIIEMSESEHQRINRKRILQNEEGHNNNASKKSKLSVDKEGNGSTAGNRRRTTENTPPCLNPKCKSNH